MVGGILIFFAEVKGLVWRSLLNIAPAFDVVSMMAMEAEEFSARLTLIRSGRAVDCFS